MTKVSIIIPVYNTENFLPRCMESVCNQTLSDIEIICINDCSTDNSLEILKEYPVKIIDLPRNRGAAYARNKGIESATGDYIGFVDSDDFVDLDFYEKLYNKAVKTGADAVKGNLFECNQNGLNPVLTDFYNMNQKISENPVYFYYGFTSAIYKRTFLTNNHINFPEGISYFEDPYFSIKACLKYKNLTIDNNAIYYYCKHTDSTSNKDMGEDFITKFPMILDKILETINNSDTNPVNYFIIFDFIHQFLLEKIYDAKLDFKTKEKLTLYMSNLIRHCKYPNNSYFKETLKRLPSELVLILLKGNIKINACANKE